MQFMVGRRTDVWEIILVIEEDVVGKGMVIATDWNNKDL